MPERDHLSVQPRDAEPFAQPDGVDAAARADAVESRTRSPSRGCRARSFSFTLAMDATDQLADADPPAAAPRQRAGSTPGSPRSRCCCSPHGRRRSPAAHCRRQRLGSAARSAPRRPRRCRRCCSCGGPAASCRSGSPALRSPRSSTIGAAQPDPRRGADRAARADADELKSVTGTPDKSARQRRLQVQGLAGDGRRARGRQSRRCGAQPDRPRHRGHRRTGGRHRSW